jgi:hypothetical protein
MWPWRSGTKIPSNSSVKSVGDAMKIEQFRVEYIPNRNKVAFALVADSSFSMSKGDELTLFLREDQVNRVLAQMLEALANAQRQ